jgi:hypothetical protein
MVLAFLGLPFVFSRKLRSKMPARLLLMVLLVSGLACAAGLIGCGGAATSTPAAKTYNLTMTATSGSIQQSQTVTLTLQ